ncbi:MAG: hypothetical protein H7177_17705 [Rhizobacter sp.]|nr:hypothetical protein [Bacteriovorax sp.]
MQGLPAKIMPQKPQHAAVKTDAKASAAANNKLNINPASYGKQEAPAVDPKTQQAQSQLPQVQGEAAKGESKGSFAELFSGLVGNEANKVEGKGEKVEKLPAEMAAEAKQQASAETKVDSLLKTKAQSQGTDKFNNVAAMSTDKALSADVLKNIDNLIQRNPPADPKIEGMDKSVDEKIAATSTNLDQLLKSLKGGKGEVEVSDDTVEIGADGKEIKNSNNSKDAKNTKQSSPLDFLLKQSKESDVVSTTKEGKLLNSNPETRSSLGLSSEDFVGHMKEAKNMKGEKVQSNKIDLDGQMYDVKELAQKQMNAGVKSYGQKQNLLDNGLIKNTNDLAFKDTKFKASADEMSVGATKVGADLGQVKESFIPVMGKQEQASHTDTQNAGKVLDLSKIDTANHTEIIKRISDYVQQNQVANSSSLDLTVRHESLGQFNIQVNKPLDPRSQAMDMQITTSTAEGHDFFMKNEIGLMKNLNQAGIQLSDLRIVSGGESAGFNQTDSRQSGHNNNSQQAPREFMSFENGDHSQGSDRRKELWQEARANQQRYGA